MIKEGKEIMIGTPWLCQYIKCGPITILTVFGFRIYERVGIWRHLFGYIYKKDES